MNSYEKARDEAAEKEMVELTWKHIIANRDIHIEFLDGQIEALRAAVRSAYDALEHCAMFDTSGVRGEYDYGEIVNRRTPDVGQRFKTPKEAAQEALKTLKPFLEPGTPTKTYQNGLEAASEHLLRLAERTDAGHTQGIGVALVRAAREILELGKGDL